MGTASMSYTWEYAGSVQKLVVTPLTERCAWWTTAARYASRTVCRADSMAAGSERALLLTAHDRRVFLTLAHALALGFGGNPYGPAGTGKTESVKALGSALGRQVLVFNCDEQFDVRAMGRIFVGLLQCGAWGCFDEFNRLTEAVLSAVSGQVQAIQAALREGACALDLCGRRVPIHSGAALFVTLNPAGKGYGGRSVLPDNLKQMFRRGRCAALRGCAAACGLAGPAARPHAGSPPCAAC